MNKPLIYADFNNADASGSLRLNCAGTQEDLARIGLKLQDGMQLIVYDDELEAEAHVHYSSEEQLWLARIDWTKVRSHSP